MKLTVLADNIARKKDLKSEHGFSALIEKEGAEILFDTGASSLVLDNARALGKDLTGVKHIVLSHGHYDHTGGLAAVLSVAKQAKVYAHPAALEGKYKKLLPWIFKSIGMGRSLPGKLAGEDRVILTEKPFKLCEEIIISGEIERKFPDVSTTGGFFRKTRGKYLKENIPDDMAIFITSAKGLSIVSGCSHAGVLNIIDWALKVTGREKVYA